MTGCHEVSLKTGTTNVDFVLCLQPNQPTSLTHIHTHSHRSLSQSTSTSSAYGSGLSRLPGCVRPVPLYRVTVSTPCECV